MTSTNAMPATGARAGWRAVIVLVVIVSALVAAWLTRQRWMPAETSALAQPHADDAHSHDDHGHDHDNENAITLSSRGLKNIGYRPAVVELRDFERTVTTPAMVVEKPGQSQIHLASPVGGIVTEIYVIQGEAIQPGSKMFEVRLTHEDLVVAQQEYLKTAESLDVVDREIARLELLGEGIVPGRRVLEQQYEKQKLEATQRAAEQALLLHGLNESQVAEIQRSRQLLQSFTVYAPEHSHAGEGCHEEHTFHVQRLPVFQGQEVTTNQELAVLADHCELYIQGRAFEDDAARLRTAVREGWKISATMLTDGEDGAQIDDLKLLFLADTIDPQTRAFSFYLRLPNRVVLDRTGAENHRFIEWRFKPGQRLELHIPVERWEKQIVLPVEAVVDEGAERYVFRQNGDQFERVAVHVAYRDARSAVIANDGAIFPGDVVAGHGAYQMHLALKNRMGGGVDPHAGHNH